MKNNIVPVRFPRRAVSDFDEKMELAMLRDKTCENIRRKREADLEEELRKEKAMRRKEKKEHRKNILSIIGLFGTGVCLYFAAGCAVSGHFWTMIFPVLANLLLMRKVGWL